MRAMVLHEPRMPLVEMNLPDREPAAGEVCIRVAACGVCRTDLHVVDGDLPRPKLPIIPGHEIVGRVEALGEGVTSLEVGDRVGVPWLAHTCGHCPYCASSKENLCDEPLFTGYTRDGGYAETTLADARYTFRLPPGDDDVAFAPLLCAGLIGWRALTKTGEAVNIGLFGFGAAAHILAQVIKWQGRTFFAFTRPGDTSSQAFARELGAAWAGGSDEPPPQPLDAAIIFAPIGSLVVTALRSVRKGGRVICAGIHMSDVPSFPYDLLWEEREIVSIANLTRRDAEQFLRIVPHASIRTTTKTYTLSEANRALADLRQGAFDGAAVLVPRW